MTASATEGTENNKRLSRLNRLFNYINIFWLPHKMLPFFFFFASLSFVFGWYTSTFDVVVFFSPSRQPALFIFFMRTFKTQSASFLPAPHHIQILRLFISFSLFETSFYLKLKSGKKATDIRMQHKTVEMFRKISKPDEQIMRTDNLCNQEKSNHHLEEIQKFRTPVWRRR